MLAAGAGTRFGGEPKLLADLHGRPLVAHAVAAALAAREVERVVVVVGAHGEAVARAAAAEADRAASATRATRRPRLDVVHCPGWAAGQSASLRAGLAALAGSEKVLVLVGDQPGVTAAAIDRLAREPPGSRAAYEGRPGHPAVLGRELAGAAAGLSGDRGLRDVAGWRLVECADVARGDDVDTWADLAAARQCG
ncbi:MAG TPA: NTP transferase domain-containing protein [Solirubrobacteraceae bacterium]|nr:NTP transferase domain-containing protein [Solirubrobacteraceae bacterium]